MCCVFGILVKDHVLMLVHHYFLEFFEVYSLSKGLMYNTSLCMYQQVYGI